MMTVMEIMIMITVMEMMTVIEMMKMQVGETKILELEEELRVVANNLKSLEVFMMMMMIMMMMHHDRGDHGKNSASRPPV